MLALPSILVSSLLGHVAKLHSPPPLWKQAAFGQWNVGRGDCHSQATHHPATKFPLWYPLVSLPIMWQSWKLYVKDGIPTR